MYDIIEDLLKRGLLDNFTSLENVKKILNNKTTIYCGFDPSNKSLQLGNFVMISMLRRLKKAGHRIIGLVGGATGMIGDPSGKKSERSFLTKDDVIANAKAIAKQVNKFLDFGEKEDVLFLNNYDWWSKINSLDFLRDYGKFFQINQMLAKDIVKSRLETGISYAEFSYSILQSGDFNYLYENHNCQIQVGGGDQWGNLTASLDFLRKKHPQSNAECFTIKLITDSEGRKFGKSERGALFLDPRMTTPFYIYQYFMNVSDIDVKKYLYIFDERPVEELDKIFNAHMEKPELRNGQKELAYSITSLIHSNKVADTCVKLTETLFKEEYSNLTKTDFEYLESVFENKLEITGEEKTLVDVLIESKLASSKREAREFIQNNSIKINGNKVNDLNFVIDKQIALLSKYIIIKRGKKNMSLIILK